ncbi:hypothetical protein SLE2022_323960 [Rubroshorea leprosula]
MASSLQIFRKNLARVHRSPLVFAMRLLSSDALVEVKPGEVGMVSGIPEQHLRRRVRLFFLHDFRQLLWIQVHATSFWLIPTQGSGKVGKWRIDFLSTQKWENPLMGWTSTGDPYANVGDAALEFDSEEAAKAFAEKYGWEYTVKKPHTPILKPKSYADNFKWKGPPSTEEN